MLLRLLPLQGTAWHRGGMFMAMHRAEEQLTGQLAALLGVVPPNGAR